MDETLPHGYVLFCDDIRHEVGGKPSFMGAYLKGLRINGALPAQLVKFCAFVTYIDSFSQPHGNPVIKLFLPGSEDAFAEPQIPLLDEIEKSKQRRKSGKPTKNMIVRLEFQVAPLEIKEPGLIRVVAAYDGGEIELGRLKVSINSEMVETQSEA